MLYVLPTARFEPMERRLATGGEVRVMASRWRRMIGWLRRPHAAMAAGSLLLIGLVLGVGGLAGTAAFVSYTNTEDFCLSCHEMRAFPYAEFQQSAHWRSASGVKPGCPDCHVPTALGPKMWAKIRASYSELPGHFLGTINTPEKFEAHRLAMAQSVWAKMKATDSRECRGCHDVTAMALDEQAPRARAQHEDAAKSGETCIDCHKGIAHTKPVLPEDAAAEEEDFSL